MTKHRYIFKIQIPLFSTDPNALALVYNKSRKIQFFMSVSPELLALTSGRPKVYVYGAVKDGGFEIGDEAPGQEW